MNGNKNGNRLCADNPTTKRLIKNYFYNLVNLFFKILPMREKQEDTLPVYIKSLQAELLGSKELIDEAKENPLYLTLLAILQYLIDNPDCPIPDVKREVFKAISVCNSLGDMYKETEAER